MASCSVTNRTTHNQKTCISLQASIAYMIPDPSAYALNLSNELESLHQPIGNIQEQRYGINTPIDTQQQQIENDNREEPHPFEIPETQRLRNSLERQEQMRNESASSDIPSAVLEEHLADSLRHQQGNGCFTPLPNTIDFMSNTFRLPTGCRIRSLQYQLFKDRLRTFANWPCHLTQTPRQLAEAGFYSLGTADVVRCFACDGGLKNWEPEDEPWIEHARWFSNCDYLFYVKGEEFIRLVGLMDEESDDEDEEDPSRNDKDQLAERMQALDLDDNKGHTEPSVLDADCVQSVLQTGFSEISVLKAINDLLKEGREDYGAHDLVALILDKEELEAEPEIAQKSSNVGTGQGFCSFGDGSLSLRQEHENLKLQMMCTECKEHVRNVLFLPCKHHTVCEKCSSQIYVCFTCFRIVRKKVKTYM